MRQKGTLSAMYSVHRFEVAPMYIVVCVWGGLFGVENIKEILSVPFLLKFLINIITIFSGFVINAYSDYPIDKLSAIKSNVALGVEKLGESFVIKMFIFETIVAVILSTLVAYQIHNYSYLIMEIAGIAAGIFYNVEPIRLKKRGLWNPTMMAIRFGWVPAYLQFSIIYPNLSKEIYYILTGLTLISFSRGFWNCISDTSEDSELGINTPAVKYGASKTMKIAVLTFAISLFFLIMGFWSFVGSLWTLIGVLGCIVAFGGRFRLMLKVSNDESAITLLSNKTIRKADNLWSLMTYYFLLVPSIVNIFNIYHF